MNVKCEHCNKEFFKSPCYIKRTKRNFCSNKCYQQRKINRQLINCLVCKTPVERVPSKIKSHVFCSKKCSGKFFHTQKNIVYKLNTCISCNMDISYPRKYCSTCIYIYTNNIIDQVPDRIKIRVRDFLSDKNKFSRIRINARHVLSDLSQACAICNYDTIVQCCHIIPIADFSLDDFIGIINHPSNLILLCANHHLELDRGLLRIPVVIK
jgi:hypothetical protein